MTDLKKQSLLFLLTKKNCREGRAIEYNSFIRVFGQDLKYCTSLAPSFKCLPETRGATSYNGSYHQEVWPYSVFRSFQDISFEYPESTLYDYIEIWFFYSFNILFMKPIRILFSYAENRHIWRSRTSVVVKAGFPDWSDFPVVNRPCIKTYFRSEKLLSPDDFFSPGVSFSITRSREA